MPFFRKSAPVSQPIIHELYSQIVQAARQPHFYAELSVPDTVDGRFDILCIHMFLASRRLKDVSSAESSYTAQALFDLLFADMDAQLRQMGVSDLKVGKEVKAMVKAYMGRVEAYDAALDANDTTMLPSAIIRNVFRESEETVASEAIAYYMRAAHTMLATQDVKDILTGSIHFPDAANNKF